MNYEMIKRNYDRGLWNHAQLEMAVKKGVLTRAEADAIYAGANTPKDSAVSEAFSILHGDTEVK